MMKKTYYSKRPFLAIIPALIIITACGTTTSGSIDTDTEATTSDSTSNTTTSTTTPTTPPTRDDDVIFNIYGMNDFHGQVKYEETSPYATQIGLPKLATIFDNYREDNPVSFFLSQGDMWQETYESNSNRGEYVTKAMNMLGFDSMTLGNHEFDWGDQYIVSNGEIANFPILAANIYDRVTGELVDYAKPSTVIEKENVRIGVIGVLDPNTYNSITANRVSHLEFKSKVELSSILVEEANYLRDIEKVDMVVLSYHGDFKSTTFPSSYNAMIEDAELDAVFGGHSHTKTDQKYTRSDGKIVPILQAYSYGTAIGEMQFKALKDGGVEYVSSRVKNTKDFADVEENQEMIDLYLNNYDVDELIAEEIGNAVGNFSSGLHVANFAATVGYNYVKTHEVYGQYDIKGFFHNQGRNELNDGIITFGDLFQALPFDNEILIFDLPWSKFLSISGSYKHNKEFENIEQTAKVKVAAIDYVGLKYIDVSECIRTDLYIRDAAYNHIKVNQTITAEDYNY